MMAGRTLAGSVEDSQDANYPGTYNFWLATLMQTSPYTKTTAAITFCNSLLRELPSSFSAKHIRRSIITRNHYADDIWHYITILIGWPPIIL